MRRPALASLLAAVLLAVVLSGCTSASTDNAGDYTGVRKDVAQAVDDIVHHASKRESRKLCDGFLTTKLKAQLTALAKRSGRGTDCADQLEESLRDVDAFDLEIRSLRVSGRNATVTVRVKTSADKDPVGTLRMVDERGWRLSRLP